MKKTLYFVLVFVVLIFYTPALYSGDTSTHKPTYTFSKSDIHWLNRSTTNGSALLSALIMFLASLISSSVIIYFGYRTYKQWEQDQQWKKEDANAKRLEAIWRRKEAIFKRIDSLSATPGTHNAFLMLSSSDRDVPLWDKSDAAKKYERVKREEVVLALLPHSILPNVYSRKESAIRDSFSDFFNRLSHAADLLADGELVEQKDMQTFMEPLVFIFKHLKMSKDSIDHILLRHLFLILYYRKSNNIIQLFKKFNIYVSDEDEMKKQYAIVKSEVDNNEWVRLVDEDIIR